MRHAANSAGAIAHPASRYDLVRCGIAVYGIAPSAALAEEVPLAPALRLVTAVSHVQRVPAGEGISYGLRYRPLRDTVVATLPLGYADGVARSLPLLGQTVLVGGQRCPMAGVITMDRSEEHTSELQSLMRISYAVFCLKKKKKHNIK